MIILRHFLILIFSGSVLLLASQASAQDSLEELYIGSEIEIKLVTENNDTFFAIALREFGHPEIGVALANYNQLPVSAVFSAEQEVYYPNQFAARPNSLEVVYSKGNVSYFPGGSEYSTGQVIKGDIFFPADVIDTGTDGFLSLELPLGEAINIQPERRFKIEQLRCLPNDAYCPVLIDEEYGRIYTNIKSRTVHPEEYGRINANITVPVVDTSAFETIATPYQLAAVRGGPKFDYDNALELQDNVWPVQEKNISIPGSDCSEC